MAKFFVFDTFEVASRNLFVLAGEIREGEIRAGMKVHIRLNSSVSTTATIHQIEFSRRHQGREDVCLCIFNEDDTELMILRGLNIGNEMVEVTD
jgi:hypothetical protein